MCLGFGSHILITNLVSFTTFRIVCKYHIAYCIQPTDSRYPDYRHIGANAFLRQRQTNDENACQEIGEMKQSLRQQCPLCLFHSPAYRYG